MTAPPADRLDVRIRGEGVSPESLPLRDLLEVLRFTLEAVEATAESEGADRDDVRLSLTAVAGGSACPHLSLSPAAARAAHRFTERLNPERFAELPPRARDRTRDLIEKVRRSGWESVEFAPGGAAVAAAAVRADTDYPDRLLLRGRTTVFGYNLRPGGEGRHRGTKLRLADGSVISAKVRSAKLAKALGALLYENVCLEGEATWDALTGKIVAFRADGLADYRPPRGAAGAREALRAVAEASSGWWRDVDPDEFVNDLRAED